MPEEQDDRFLEDFLSMVVELLTLNGNAREVALLVSGEVSLEESDIQDEYRLAAYDINIKVPASVYLGLPDYEKTKIGNIISRPANLALPFKDSFVKDILIHPILKPRPGWRADAISWLRGEGINNQGKVRSDNIASRQHDGLLFRSPPEINLYRALKDEGVMFAPLPVFLRGGKSYQRIEPDFVILWRGIVMVVEVDGDTVHRETPAEADKRTRSFKYEGAIIEHVAASDCETYEKAKRCAGMLISALEKAKETR